MGGVTLSGDGTIAQGGALTVTKTSGTAFGAAATLNLGTNLKGAAIAYSVGGKEYIAHIAGGSQHDSGIAPLILPTATLVVYGL